MGNEFASAAKTWYATYFEQLEKIFVQNGTGGVMNEEKDYAGPDRRKTMTEFDIRSKILEAIDSEEDKKHRNLLLLMFGVIETTEKYFARIEYKIDHMMVDELALKKLVLNGLVDSHHDDHEWIKDHRRDHEDKYRPLLLKADKALEWVDVKMREERTDREHARTLPQKFKDALVAQAGTIVATGIAGAMAAAYFTK